MKKILVVLLALFLTTGCSIQANTDEQLPKEQIGEEIGNIPAACSVPECAVPPGNTFYSIKGKDSKKYVASLSFDGEKHYRWTKINEA
ncbi:membrane lipoprotein lipid attachment site-containing protein [Paenibacillus sp. JDR-2]|uniref:membrane lipoprotein lipid attachment site-containing protein n=1 Tax=Paenibacillus sp. (strain JDR-2) TaxID=324057 RepID=UPI000166BB73|nr:hypothetical protein [Paenibacillus sp. JDR-2]ACT01842.1 hypothetical protein Pjdr2_3201 [Paenibacillus sp. JDR-2]